MRASRIAQTRNSKPARPAGGLETRNFKEVHISGAEGLYEFSEAGRIGQRYLSRAMNHSKGKPDRVVLTMERIEVNPIVIPPLPVSTVACSSPDGAGKVVHELLSASGISKKAIRKGLKIVTADSVMHGASLILSESGERVEPDKKRGVRVSRLGIQKEGDRILSRKLAKKGINTETVKEAIILASKVASCKGVIAELCISDDPGYTTGYIASGESGYIRITNIKERGSHSGGRVFFIEEDSDVEKTIEYLERAAVMVG